MKRLLLLFPIVLAGCGLDQIGRPPEFTPLEGSYEHHAIYASVLPKSSDPSGPGDHASLWTGGSESLLGDRRASDRGDILTVVISINDRADISNETERSREGNQSLQLNEVFGYSKANALDTGSSSSFSGNGSVRRSEKITLRIAATIVERLPNGVLRLEGQQEIRVNNELRELIVTGYVRPSDISRRNEVAYDKIAGVRVAYGGRGQISEIQQPRYGQQIADILLPF